MRFARFMPVAMLVILVAILCSLAPAMAKPGDISSWTDARSNDVLRVDPSGNFLPGATGTINLGSSSLQFQNAWFAGTMTAAAVTASGTQTFTATGGNAVALTGVPANTATLSLMRLGNAIAGGNSAANGGTWVGINAPAVGAGSAADFEAYQANGVTVFRIDKSGNLSSGTYNGNTITAGTGTLTLAASKTLTASNSITLAGTDATVMTFPATSATLARTDAGNTFTGHQTIEGVTSTGATGTGALVFATSPTLITPTLGAASATAISITGTSAAAVNLGDGAVSQLTSIATGVTVNAASGVITTQTASAAAGTVQSFVVTNSAVGANSSVQVTVNSYSGAYSTNGLPVATVSAVSAGSFTINILNAHGANALNGTLKIAFAVL